MRFLRTLLTVQVVFALTVSPLVAHHSVAREFDQTRATTIQGVITRVEWTNPHVRITLESKGANGSISSWLVEIAPPNVLKRDGIPKDVFELAKSCTMEIWPARDGSKTATG